ncbi:MAG: hypothetical protein ACP5NS_04045 [Candidatus Pacearchaeota archaeon]
MDLVELKTEYEKMRKLHDLPTFEEMNSIFDIGKIERDSGHILRDIRKVCSEKISHYLRLLELMLNPSQASPMFLVLLKEITQADKKVMDSVFTHFIELEINSYKLDIIYSSENEAAFIKKVYAVWKEHTPQIAHLVEILDRNWKSVNKQSSKSRDYFN